MSQQDMNRNKKLRRILDPNKEGKRKNTLMKRVNKLRSRGDKIHVDIDEKKQPVGKHGDELLSYIGVLGREVVPIWVKNWRSKEYVELKSRIWEEVQEGFELPTQYRDECLRRVGEAARNFRHDLYDTYVKPNIDNDSVYQRPPAVIKYYTNIGEDDWKRFVQYRKSEDFKKLSEQGKEIRKLNQYCSRSGRVGYRKLDQQIVRVNASLCFY